MAQTIPVTGALRRTRSRVGPGGSAAPRRAPLAVARVAALVAGLAVAGSAVARLEDLPPGLAAANAYAIHGEGSARRYLAWTPVPGPAPDFHRLEYFAPLEQARVDQRAGDFKTG